MPRKTAQRPHRSLQEQQARSFAALPATVIQDLIWSVFTYMSMASSHRHRLPQSLMISLLDLFALIFLLLSSCLIAFF